MQQINRDAHIFCIFAGNRTNGKNRQDRNEKNTPPAPADQLLLDRRGTGALAAQAHRSHYRRFARQRRRTAGTPAQHAQPRSGQGHHVPPQKQLVFADHALPHAEHGGTVVRQGFHAHQNRRASKTPAAAFRRTHLLSETGLLHTTGLHLVRYRTAAQRQHEHRPRRHRLLCAQPQMEHRVRPDQDQGQPGAHQLVERPAVHRPEHRQQRIQSRPRLRILRRIQHASGRGVQPLGQRLRNAGRRPQLGQFGDRRSGLHGTSGTLSAGTVQIERRRARRRLRRRRTGQDTAGGSLFTRRRA